MNNKDEMGTEQEMINTHRKFSEPRQEEDHLNDLQLALSPSFPPSTPSPPPQPPEEEPPPPLQEEQDHDNDSHQPLSPSVLPPPDVIVVTPMGLVPVYSPIPLTVVPPPARRRPCAVHFPSGKSETIPAPFRWATSYRATIRCLADLETQEIFTITGYIECMKCKCRSEIEYDLREKFNEVSSFIINNRDTMHDQAPNKWLNPGFPICKLCEIPGNRVKPVIAEKKKDINWLFLLLGQMIGCCYVPQLKYFCKHTNNQRSGAKDRLLYRTYLGLCKQLLPNGPFDP